VLASLDLFDADYLTGQEVTTDLWLINDSRHDAKIHVNLILTAECPELIPEAECFANPLNQWSYDFELKADSIAKTPLTWTLPTTEGGYWLTARTTGAKDRAVLSQRFVRAIEKARISDKAAQRTFVVLGGDAAAEKYFAGKGLNTTESLDNLDPNKQMIIIWEAGKLTSQVKDRAAVMCVFAARGGRIAVLSTRSWGLSELADVSIAGASNFSRVFAYEDMRHPVLKGIGRDWMMRWNGLPGTVAVAQIEGGGVKNAVLIAWGREPKQTVLAEVAAAKGGGKILFCQLDIQGRLDEEKPEYDPAAERIFANILDW
jgi:hypothetical protein